MHAMGAVMDVSVIYVNWNSAEEILESIRTVREKTQGVSYEIIVVDNASAQGTAPLEADPAIRLIKNPVNAGFGAGCNLGARHSTGRYLFFFNPDTRMENDATSILTAFLDAHPQAGAAGPKVLDASGQIHFGAARSFHCLTNEFLEHSALTFRFPKNRILGQPYLSYWDHDSTRKVDSLIGAAMLVRRDVFEAIDGFDEQYFLYCEEVDLCKRIWNAGYCIQYVHTAVITHLEKHCADQYFKDFHALILQHLRSLSIYMKKHHGAFQAFLWRIMIVALYGIKALTNRNTQYLQYCRFGLGLV